MIILKSLWVLALSCASAAPRLVAVVVVDQMRADYLDRYAAEYKGAFKVLPEQGAVFVNAHHAHIPTETGPSHALILTGKFPGRTGVVGNEWLMPYSTVPVYVAADSVHGLGPENLMAYTLGDALKAKDAESRVVSISLKDRAAIMMGGKKPDAVLWYDKKKRAFVTSSYYARPAWLDAFNARLKSGSLAETNSMDYETMMSTPNKADVLLLELAKEVLRRYRLGQREHPDLLAVSFSATDPIGHHYGPDGPEMHEQMLGTDARLAELMKALSSSVGSEGFDLVLTADHGVCPRPEDPSGKAMGARRILWNDLGASVEKALKKGFPAPEPWLLANEYPNIYLNRGQARKLGLDWRVFLRQAASALKSIEGVEQVYIPDEINPSDPYAEVYRRSIMPGRSGDIIVRMTRGVIVTEHATGTSHGTPYDYDTHVPLIFWGPDFKRGRFEEPAWVADLAPTLGALLGVDFPPAEGSRVRREAFRRD